MITMSLQMIAKIVHGQLIGADIKINNVAIDTRKINNNCIFIALKGKKFDAHNFAIDAIRKGALALLISKYLPINISQILVSDTRIALGLLSAWVRQQITIRMIALTGSSGKTSVKEISAAILHHCGNVLYTSGNFNNDIGVPLTLLLLKPKHKFAVIELGANHIGEISYMINLVKAESVLINNIAVAHLDGFGSLAGVAQAKGEIFNGLATNGTAIINADSNDWKNWQNKITNQRLWRFSLQKNRSVEFFATCIHVTHQNTSFKLHTPFGAISVVIPLLGYHNIANVLAATALTMSVSATLDNVRQGLSQLKTIPGRLYPISLNSQQLILDDSYNANVSSMIAAAQFLGITSGYKIMVVGYMDELGVKAKEYHIQVGIAIRAAGIDRVLSFGGLSYLISKSSGLGKHFTDQISLIAYLKDILRTHIEITILVKGSRNSAMDKIVRSLSVQKIRRYQ
ncbi:UDP-N-acetylmuramoyl-tripeptide--D-alanyl-D-alanine ligase [Candidatus Profftia lariciata]|uniref:UDP-N-acetylmuramoyl-tripeptide--D-alanyl-D- alanine ligase n=1 Tax=Candidatus Profftia lariciata TaxID=1987921 RepID=UPI001D02F130|nr:UDP-N-acetylmuramoyl-tripeptide--D-alanyl-D-alanine ligase [Candidatus Profftia lariciata]UDG81387.1 UDP-N-acetylmuramoyl-tripeptide--D-alanyl-D-alanine ligase [Candidatus Profftia lariciata]